MAFSTVQHKSASGAIGTAPSVTLTSTPIQGNLLVAAVLQNVNTTQALSNAGWTVLTNVAAGSAVRSSRLFWKIAGAGEPTAVSATNTTAAWAMAVIEYSSGGLTVNAPTENGQANASGTTTTPIVTPTASRVAVAVCWIGVVTNSTWSAEQINASATGVNVDEAVSHSGASAALFDEFVASTSGTFQGSTTAGTAATGVGNIAVFTGTAATPRLPAQLRRHVAWRGGSPSRGRF